MKNHTIFFITILLLWFTRSSYAQSESNWVIDFGIRGFKYSADSKPNEIQYNSVFSRWEKINQNKAAYNIIEYESLKPLYFNINLGIDLFIRYKKYFLLKLGYDYSNPFGIGGNGNIKYRDVLSGMEIRENKEFNYTSHQINLFFGPIITIPGNGSEIYLAFSPMPPTWINYKEKYFKLENGEVIENYNKRFTGFFGNCRALIGIQVPITEKLKIGSEAVFAFSTSIEIKSGDIYDNSFQFPRMKWNFTLRYEIM